MQDKWGRNIVLMELTNPRQLQPGDVIVYKHNSGGHIVMYVGPKNGGYEILHSSSINNVGPTSSIVKNSAINYFANSNSVIVKEIHYYRLGIYRPLVPSHPNLPPLY